MAAPVTFALMLRLVIVRNAPLLALRAQFCYRGRRASRSLMTNFPRYSKLQLVIYITEIRFFTPPSIYFLQHLPRSLSIRHHFDFEVAEESLLYTRSVCKVSAKCQLPSAFLYPLSGFAKLLGSSS